MRKFLTGANAALLAALLFFCGSAAVTRADFLGPGFAPGILEQGASGGFTVATGGRIFLPNGTSAAPSLSFTSDTDLGIYRVAADSFGIASSGGTYSTGVYFAPNGSVGGPAYANTLGGGNTGMYFPGNDLIAWSVNNSKKLDLTASDMILAAGMNFEIGTSGSGGWLIMDDLKHAVGTFTEDYESVVRKTWHNYVWTNAMIVAGGADTTEDITIATLDAKTVITNAYIIVDTACTGATTLTMSLGIVGANYEDLVIDSDIKAAANTIYGDAVAEHGTSLAAGVTAAGSRTATTALKVQVNSTVDNLDQVLTCTGRVWIETAILP
jgi:hypothetical protein